MNLEKKFSAPSDSIPPVSNLSNFFISYFTTTILTSVPTLSASDSQKSNNSFFIFTPVNTQTLGVLPASVKAS